MRFRIKAAGTAGSSRDHILPIAQLPLDLPQRPSTNTYVHLKLSLSARQCLGPTYPAFTRLLYVVRSTSCNRKSRLLNFGLWCLRTVRHCTPDTSVRGFHQNYGRSLASDEARSKDRGSNYLPTIVISCKAFLFILIIKRTTSMEKYPGEDLSLEELFYALNVKILEQAQNFQSSVPASGLDQHHWVSARAVNSLVDQRFINDNISVMTF